MLLLTSLTAQAQTTDISNASTNSAQDVSDIIQEAEKKVEKESTKKIEKIEVTGSHIKRIDVEGVSPLENIDNEEFMKRGAIEISDVLKESPAFEAVYEGSGHVRFRGQHAGNVLILLNGMRLPKLEGGYYTSIRNIPTSAVGRIEMLKDGGSAVYGSDALSGVMNFITRTDLDGGSVNMSTNVNEFGEGAQTNYDGTFGKNFANGNIMGVLQYSDSSGYTDLDLGSLNTNDGVTSVKGSEATISGNGRLRTGPTCADGSVCSTDPLQYDQARNDNQNFSALLTGKYEFTDFDVAVLGLFHRKDATSRTDPARLNWRNNSATGGLNTGVDVSRLAPSSYRDDVLALQDNGFVNVSGSFVEELGEYQTEAQEDNYSFQTRINGYVSDDWTWDVQGSYAITDFERTVVSGEADQNRLREMFENGDWNITAPFGEKSDLSSAQIQPTYRSYGQMLTSKAVLAGEIFNTESLGSLSAAVGVELQQESFEFDNDQALIDGSALARPVRNFEGEREVQSAFLEFSAMPSEKVEMQLAGRVDNYSDVGSTFNPKFGLSLRPAKQVLLRSSVASGFRAPGITDLYAGEEQNLRFFEDTNNCPGGVCGGRRNYDVTTYTTNETKPETALSYSFGTVIQPTKNTSFSIDQWNFEGEDTLSAIYQEDYLQIEKNQGQAGLAAVGAEINRNETTGELESMRFRRVINLGQRTLRGIDAGFDTRIQLSGGMNLLMGASGMFIFERRTQRFSFEDEINIPDTWKNRNFIGISNRNHFARFTMLTVSKALVGRGDDMETLPQYTEYDFNYSYTASWGGRFSFTLKNLANTRPPVQQRGSILSFARTDRNFSSFSPLRRRLFLSYNQAF